MTLQLGDKVEVTGGHFFEGTEMAGGSMHQGKHGRIVSTKPYGEYQDAATVPTYTVLFVDKDGSRHLETFPRMDLKFVSKPFMEELVKSGTKLPDERSVDLLMDAYYKDLESLL